MTAVRWLWRFFFSVGIATNVFCAPPNRAPAESAQKVDGHPQETQQNSPPPGQEQQPPPRPMYQFAYSKYLEQVVKILESDPKFTEKLKTMPEQDIKSGVIADHIHDLGPHVFEQLTKAKLAEIERLREVIAKQIETDGGTHNIKVPDHIDVQNWEHFGKEDLRKLIQTTVADMEEIDRQRKKEFKEYEMRKKAEVDHKMANMSPEEREKYRNELESKQQRHNEHEKLNHPGAREQLEEVWEEKDKMDKENFDARTFFALHDLNSDGFWSERELEALFQLELQKLYNETNPDDDPRERIEEMYRMREHVVKQMDKNGDRMISLEEFMNDAEVQQANKDPGWKDIGDQPVYTDEELQRFESEYAKQQGWGEYAYSTPVPTRPPQHVEPQGQYVPQHQQQQYGQQQQQQYGQQQQQQYGQQQHQQYGQQQHQQGPAQQPQAQLPQQKVEVPQQQAQMPQHQAQVPQQQAHMPQHQAQVPQHQAQMAQQQAQVPQQQAQVPQQHEVPQAQAIKIDPAYGV